LEQQMANMNQRGILNVDVVVVIQLTLLRLRDLLDLGRMKGFPMVKWIMADVF
jgi:hypothetical protein